MPLCLYLPLPRGLPISVAVFVFLCLGPFRICSLLCVLFLCLSLHHSAGVVSSAFLMMGEPRTDGDSPNNLKSFPRNSPHPPADFGKDLPQTSSRFWKDLPR